MTNSPWCAGSAYGVASGVAAASGVDATRRRAVTTRPGTRDGGRLGGTRPPRRRRPSTRPDSSSVRCPGVRPPRTGLHLSSSGSREGLSGAVSGPAWAGGTTRGTTATRRGGCRGVATLSRSSRCVSSCTDTADSAARPFGACRGRRVARRGTVRVPPAFRRSRHTVTPHHTNRTATTAHTTPSVSRNHGDCDPSRQFPATHPGRDTRVHRALGPADQSTPAGFVLVTTLMCSPRVVVAVARPRAFMSRSTGLTVITAAVLDQLHQLVR